jgi:Thioredoxin
MCFRRRLDRSEALVEAARGAGLDVARFRVDLESHAIVEAFGADLEASRDLTLPTLVFEGDQGADHVAGAARYNDWRGAAARAGASPVAEPAPDVLAALARFGRMATAEIEAVCDLPGPRVQAELWRLAADWRVKPVGVLTGTLWELA